MEEDRFKTVPAVFIILERDGKVLLLQRVNTGYHDGSYGLPGGYLGNEEMPIDCVIRKTKEEVGITLVFPELVTIGYNMVGKVGGAHYIYLFFISKIGEQEPENLEPEKNAEMRWFDLNFLPENLAPEVKKGLEHYQKGIVYFEI